MPFDGANLALSAQDLLEAAMSASGLTLVNPGLLGKHKAEQIRQHPPGWVYRHSRSVQLVQAVALLAGAISFFLLCSADQYGWGAAAGLLTFGLAVAPLLVPVRGPAQWQERVDPDLSAVPAVVRDAALRLKDELPEVGFRLGELFQDRVNLDPYLVADYRGARVLLGIWEDERVIFHA
jgi:hypothetical protein